MIARSMKRFNLTFTLTIMKKLTTIVTLIIIGYHIGNTSEMNGMFTYAHNHHLKITKMESVNDMVLVTFNKNAKH